MFGGYTEVAAYYVNTPWPGEGEAEEDPGQIPHDYLPQLRPTDPWFTATSAPNDFILVAEFSEQEGPKPLITIPQDSGGQFDLNEFSVRIMSVDHQTLASETFCVTEDTHLILSEADSRIHAYVHHFTLHDSQARGFVRPFCMAYVTPDHTKLMSFYDEITEEFNHVSKCFKYGNMQLFVRDMTHQLSDLQYTKERYIERESGLSSMEQHRDVADTEEEKILQTATLHGIGSTITEVKSILEAASSLLNDSDLEEVFQSLEQRCRADSVPDDLPSSPDMDNFQYSCSLHGNSPRSKGHFPFCHKFGSFSDLETDWEHSSLAYKPRVVRTTNKKRFDRSLRSLHELCQFGAKEGLNRLRALHKYLSRDLCTLYLEKTDARICDPAASLLTIGQTVQVNFTPTHTSAVSTSVEKQGNTEQLSISSHSLYRGWFSSDTLGSFQSAESFLSCQDDPSIFQVPPSLAREEFATDTGGSFVESSADNIPGEEDGVSEPDRQSHTPTTTLPQVWPSSPSAISAPIPLNPSLTSSITSPTSPLASALWPAVTSCADHLSGLSSTSTGYGLLQILNDYAVSPMLLYSLLTGRPVIVAGGPRTQSDVISIITALRLFVPGQDSGYVVPLLSRPLTLIDISSAKLIGLALKDKKTVDHTIPRAIKKYVTVLDLEQRSLWAPPYEGGVVTDLYNKRKGCPGEGAYLSYIHSVLLELSAKAFLFYHSFCLHHHSAKYTSNSSQGIQRQRYQQGALEFLSTAVRVNVQDAHIVQYLCDVVRLQQVQEIQSTETGSAGCLILDHSHCKLFKMT